MKGRTVASKPTEIREFDDVRIEQESSLDADFGVVQDAMKNPHLWLGSKLQYQALERIRNATTLAQRFPEELVSGLVSAPDIAAALERVRKALFHVPNSSVAESGIWNQEALAALAAIKAHITEIERERDEMTFDAAEQNRLRQAAERERDGERMRVRFLEQVVKEAEADLLLAAQQNTRLSERLDRLEGALRPLREYAIHQANAPIRPIWYRIYRSPDYDPTNAEARVICERVRELEAAIARAALAEEPYADIPGAGQRGCG